MECYLLQMSVASSNTCASASATGSASYYEPLVKLKLPNIFYNFFPTKLKWTVISKFV